MRKQGMVARGRPVMSTRERICAIEIEDPVPLALILAPVWPLAVAKPRRACRMEIRFHGFAG
jgi:hypothetical protein